MTRYESAKEIYAKLGVDTDAAIAKCKEIPVSLHCWQGDDVTGFDHDGPLTGGIQTTGNYPGKARTPEELLADMDKAMSLMPGLKYPPNPPAVGNPETIGYRTGLYFVMMLLSIGIVIAAAWLSHQLTPRLGRGNAMMWATLFAVALMLVVCALMPTVNEVSDHFPADLLWRFRISSFGTHLVLWGVIGVAFGALAERTPTTREHRPAFRRG